MFEEKIAVLNRANEQSAVCYSQIIDEDRCINAQRFEDAFYSQAKAPEPAIQEIEEKETGTTTPESDTAKILELLKNPETAALLKQIVSAL